MENLENLLEKEKEEVFDFLDDLRECGVNMYGASVDLRESFGFDKPTARNYLKQWMKARS